MKYSERYKDLQVNEITDAIIMRSDHCEPCACCGEMTDYVDVCFEVYVCSDECQFNIDNDIDPNAVEES